MSNYFRGVVLVFSTLIFVGACGNEEAVDERTDYLNREDTDSNPERDAGASESCQSTPDPTACSTDAECGVGEINTEIHTSSDCMCLYGCPFTPLNKTTIERRQKQYDNLCDPRTDGNGDPCPIDDCVPPPTPVCVAGHCAFPADGG